MNQGILNGSCATALLSTLLVFSFPAKASAETSTQIQNSQSSAKQTQLAYYCVWRRICTSRCLVRGGARGGCYRNRWGNYVCNRGGSYCARWGRSCYNTCVRP